MRKGRPTTTTAWKESKMVEIPIAIWERLDWLADTRGEPIYRVIETAVAGTFGVYESPKFFRPIAEATAFASRVCFGVEGKISPNLVVSAIREGKVGGYRKKDGNRYRWFVDNNGLVEYCRNHPSIKQRQRYRDSFQEWLEKQEDKK